MTARRAHITLRTKLASALLALGHIPYDDAKAMGEDNLISLYQFDHGILHGVQPNDEFWNLTPTLIRPHREKSRRDTGIVAKVKALSDDHIEFRRKVLARPAGQKRERTGSIPARVNAWPKGRGFQRKRPRAAEAVRPS